MPKSQNTTQVFIPAGLVNPDEDVVVEIPKSLAKSDRVVAKKVTRTPDISTNSPNYSYNAAYKTTSSCSDKR